MPRTIPSLLRLPAVTRSLTAAGGAISISPFASSSRALGSISGSHQVAFMTRPRFPSFSRCSPLSSTLSRPSLAPLTSLPSIATGGLGGIGQQIRALTYGTTYQPSQRKRKRKYGFLARLKGGKLGQAILARRRTKGRRFLSH